MKELKDIMLKKNDIVHFDDGTVISVDVWTGRIASSLNCRYRITKIERPVKCKTIYEAPKQILDKEEKEYLEAVCKPFKDNRVYIKKYKDSREHICIRIENEYISFPYFKAGTMYKGMELDKEYTLKELGLFEE